MQSRFDKQLQPPPPPTAEEPKARPAPEYPEPQSSRIRLHSLNFLSARPDSVKSHVLECSCGRQLTVGEDWYTQIYDGTLVCWMCSACARCGIECSVARRRLVSVGGFTICYDCLKHYGEPKIEVRRPVLVENPMKTRMRDLQKYLRASIAGGGGGGPGEAPSAKHNIGGFYSNWWQVDHSPEYRRILRYRDYPRPEKFAPTELDPTVTHVGFYAATRVQFEQMVCPACKSKALGRSAYVAPGIARVYHRSCFRCVCCKWPLASGVRPPVTHFVFCSCNPPLQWCTRAGCERDRKEHHATFRCRLEPFHPGGREQRDTLETAIDSEPAPPPVEAPAAATADSSQPSAANKAATKPGMTRQQPLDHQKQPTRDSKLKRSKRWC